jgi:hypothetical protein
MLQSNQIFQFAQLFFDSKEVARRADAMCERFLGSVRRECLDHLLIFSDGQWYRVIKEYVGYFKRARPHQGDVPKDSGGVTERGAAAGEREAHCFPCAEWTAS